MNTLGRVVVGLPTTFVLATLLACGSSSVDDFAGNGSGAGGSGNGGSQIDTVAPTVVITQPANNTVAPPGFVTLTGTASDNRALERVEVQLRGGEPELAAGLDNWTYQSPVLAAGTYVFTARAVDTSGNTAETEVTVSLQEGAADTEAPTLAITSPAEGAVIGAGPFVVEGTASDNIGVAAVFARLNLSGATIQATGTDTWSVELDATELGSGEHLIIVNGRDLSGNLAQIVTRSITIDRSLPVAEILTAPANPTSSGDAAFTIGGDNVATYSYSVDGAAFSGAIPAADPIEITGLRDGPHELQVAGISVDGVTQTIPTVYRWTVDSTAPTAVVTPPDSPTNATSISLTVSGQDVGFYRYRLDGGPYSARTSAAEPITADGLAEGAHTIEVLGSDTLGNEQIEPTVVTWVIDVTPPDGSTTTVDGAPGAITTSDDISVTVGGPGIVEYYYELDDGTRLGPFPVGTPIVIEDLPEGEHTITIYGVDAAGNIQEPPTVITFTIDLDAVVAIVSAPPPFTNADSVTLTVSGTGVTQYEYRLIPPSGTPGALSAPTAVATPIVIDTTAPSPAEGTYRVEVFGIGSATQTVPTAVSFVVDRTAPTATLANLPAPQTNQGFLNVSVGGTGVVRYRYQLDAGAFQGPFDVAVPISESGIAAGPHTLAVFGIDAAGNEQSAPTSHSWTIDTSAAVAVLSGVPEPFTTLTTATITVEGSGVEQYRYRLDGGALQGPFAVATPITLSGLSNGPHTLEVFGINAVGTVQATATVATWTVDSTVPLALLDNPPPETTGEETFSSNVRGDGVFEYVYTLDGGPEQGPFPVATPIELGPLGLGPHSLVLVGINRAGLRQEVPTFYTWTIIQTGPGIAVVEGIPAFSNRISQTASVSGEDVVAYRWRLDGGPWSDRTDVGTVLRVEAGEGDHLLEVVGINSSDQEQAEPTVVSFTVDVTPPQVTSGFIEVLLPEEVVEITFSEAIRAEETDVEGTLVQNAPGGAVLSVFTARLTLTPVPQWLQSLTESQYVSGSVTDLAGNTTSFELEVVVAAGAVYVDGDGGTGDGSSPGDPTGSIADAAGGAEPGAIIRVTGGTYDETITIENGVAISGGWDPTFTTLDPENNPTILAPTDLTAAPPDSPTGTVTCNVASGLISGFEIRGAGGSGRAAVVVGPGCGSNVVFTQNRILANTASGVAYGVYVEGGAQPWFVENEIRGGSGDGESYAVFVERSGTEFGLFGNLIDGWHGNPVSYGIYHDDGRATMEGNEIFGGTGSKGGASAGRSCPSSGDGESVGVLLNAAVVFEGNVVYGGASGAPGATCGLSGASTSRGGVVNVTLEEFDENAILAGSGPTSGCAASLAVGLDIVDNVVVESFVDGGRACGGASDRTIGVRIRNGGQALVENAIVTGGIGVTAVAIEAEASTSFSVANVTAIDVGGTSTVGLRAASAGSVSNTILYGFDTAIVEAGPSGAPSSIANNAFAGVTSVYETSGGTSYADVLELEGALTQASGNVQDGVVFVDLDGADGDILTYEDNAVELSAQSSCEVRQGGLANVTSEAIDVESNPRTGGSSCGPTNANASGWSIGAYELD